MPEKSARAAIAGARIFVRLITRGSFIIQKERERESKSEKDDEDDEPQEKYIYRS